MIIRFFEKQYEDIEIALFQRTFGKAKVFISILLKEMEILFLLPFSVLAINMSISKLSWNHFS